MFTFPECSAIRGPENRRVRQSPSDDFPQHVIGVLPDGRVRHELALVSPVSVNLLSNVLIEAN